MKSNGKTRVVEQWEAVAVERDAVLKPLKNEPSLKKIMNKERMKNEKSEWI